MRYTIIAVLVMCSGCMNLTAREYDGENIKSSIHVTTVGKDINLAEVQWAGNKARDYSGMTTEQIAEALEQLDVKGIVRVLSLLNPALAVPAMGAAMQAMGGVK